MRRAVRRWCVRIVPPLGLLIWATLPVIGQSGTESGAKAGEWTTYGGDLANTRYAPLDQINADNFSKLEVAWRFKTDNLGPRPEYQFESTPLMVSGVLYSTAGTRRAVVALDAATGELLWMHSEHEGARGEAAPRQLSGRGLAYWTDGREERILYVTPGYRLIALDAKTGNPVPSFGKDGVVDLKLEDDQEMDLVNGEVGLHATPIVAGNTVIIGAAHLSGACPAARPTRRGTSAASTSGPASGSGSSTRFRSRASSATTPGRRTRGPTPATPASGPDVGRRRAGHGVPAGRAADRRLLRRPSARQQPVRREPRCRRSEDRQRKWHYQLVHHGIWDFDIPCAPILADITVNGQTIKAVAQPTKQAFLYVFDRVTGQPVWPIEERPVEKGDVPGEWYSPTQPFPLDAGKPSAYDLNGFLPDDLIDFTPELRAEGEKVVSKYKIGPIFTPPVVSKVEGPLGTLSLAINGGGTNWPGGSSIPRRTSCTSTRGASPASLGLVKPDDPTRQRHELSSQGSALTGARAAGRWARRLGPGRSSRDGARDTAAGGSAGEAGGGSAGGGGEGGGPAITVQGLPIVKPPYGASPRSISTRARSSGRSRTATRRTTSGTIRRSRG